MNRSFAKILAGVRLSVGVMLIMTYASGAEIVNDAPRPHVRVPTAITTPLVAATADDPAWNDAAVIPLVTTSLSPKPPPAVPIPGTEVRLLWDSDWLYVRFLCKEDHAYLPPHTPGQQVCDGDAVEVFLDPLGDCREWIELEFNAANEFYEQLTLYTGALKWDSGLRLTGEEIAHDIWVFPNENLKSVRRASAPWQIDGHTVGYIVDVAIPASEILKRTGLKKFQPMSLHGALLRYKSIAQPTGTKRDLLSLTWSPMMLGQPHRSPAAFGSIDLDPPQK